MGVKKVPVRCRHGAGTAATGGCGNVPVSSISKIEFLPIQDIIHIPEATLHILEDSFHILVYVRLCGDIQLYMFHFNNGKSPPFLQNGQSYLWMLRGVTGLKQIILKPVLETIDKC